MGKILRFFIAFGSGAGSDNSKDVDESKTELLHDLEAKHSRAQRHEQALRGDVERRESQMETALEKLARVSPDSEACYRCCVEHAQYLLDVTRSLYKLAHEEMDSISAKRIVLLE